MGKLLFYCAQSVYNRVYNYVYHRAHLMHSNTLQARQTVEVVVNSLLFHLYGPTLPTAISTGAFVITTGRIQQLSP